MLSFKPYYNWNAFNTVEEEVTRLNALEVLNLIITGMPSILIVSTTVLSVSWLSFKPYYNWNAFNTKEDYKFIGNYDEVLNLIITGMPSIPMILLEY